MFNKIVATFAQKKYNNLKLLWTSLPARAIFQKGGSNFFGSSFFFRVKEKERVSEVKEDHYE